MKADKYRWIGLAAIALLLLSNWVEFIELIARVLFVAYAFLYWKDRRDTFAILLLVSAFIILVLGIATLAQIYITPGLI